TPPGVAKPPTFLGQASRAVSGQSNSAARGQSAAEGRYPSNRRPEWGRPIDGGLHSPHPTVPAYADASTVPTVLPEQAQAVRNHRPASDPGNSPPHSRPDEAGQARRGSPRPGTHRARGAPPGNAHPPYGPQPAA